MCEVLYLSFLDFVELISSLLSVYRIDQLFSIPGDSSIHPSRYPRSTVSRDSRYTLGRLGGEHGYGGLISKAFHGRIGSGSQNGNLTIDAIPVEYKLPPESQAEQKYFTTGAITHARGFLNCFPFVINCELLVRSRWGLSPPPLARLEARSSAGRRASHLCAGLPEV